MLEEKQYQLDDFLDLERARIQAQVRKDSIETAELRAFKEQSIADTKMQLEKVEKDKDDITDYHIKTNDSIIFQMIEKGSGGGDDISEGSSRNMYIVLGSIIFLFVVILIVVLNSGKKQPVQTVYLKPKGSGGKSKKDKKKTKKTDKDTDPDDDSKESASNPDNQTNTAPPTAPPTFVQPTMAHQDDNVIRSEMQSMRQSAVSMSVGQKDGASQIIKDWLADGAPSDGGGDESEEAEE